MIVARHEVPGKPPQTNRPGGYGMIFLVVMDLRDPVTYPTGRFVWVGSPRKHRAGSSPYAQIEQIER